MATKKITLKGGQLMDANTDSVGWVADDTSGLHFEADPNADGTQNAYCTLTHMVTETNNPIWNEINFHGTYNTVTSAKYEGHITLQGIKPDGTINDIIEVYKSTGETETLTERFDLLGSSCTNDSYKHEAAASVGGAGTIDINLPLRYSKYEDVDLMPSWYDNAWGYRNALPLERSNGQLHGTQGHSAEYYGRTFYVPYDAQMSSTTQADVRFTGPDGVTELPFFQMDVTASVSAVYIVMIPWFYLDKENEAYKTSTAVDFNNYGAHLYPQYIYCYYGNATATSASDVTLGGHALFYDDFSSDLGWTQDEPANATVTIENGYLELKSAASQTSTPHAYRNMDFSGSDRTSWEVIWKIVYDTPAYTNTTAGNGPHLRITGRDNTGSGGADESNSYWEVKHFYIGAGAGESGANPAGHMWGHAAVDSGVLAYGTLYSNNIVTASVSTTQYIKFRWNKRDSGQSGNDGVWMQSDDGVRWNTLGDSGGGLTSVFDTATDLMMHVYYVGKSGVAADKIIRFDAIMAYPVMSGSKQKIHWEESFQNGTYLDRYAGMNVGAARIVTETQDLIKFKNSAGTGCYWSTASKTALGIYLGGGLSQPAIGDTEPFIYECTVVDFSRTNVAGVGEMGGIYLFDNTSLASANAVIFHVWYRTTGPIRNFRVTTLRAGTVDVDTSMSSWADADLPIKLRIVFDPKTRCAYFDIRRVGSGGTWERIYADPSIYTDMIADTYTMPGLCYRTSTTDASWVTLSNFKIYNGGPDMECGIESSTTAWLGEEDLANDYPLAIIGTPGDNDQTISFTSPTPMKRGNAMKVRTKDFGGDYNYSKTFYITDDDLISIGPSGTDQYIGMRLVFDFSFASTDEIEYDTIEFLYEVI